MILLAILGMVLRSAPAPEPVEPAPVCTVAEWVTPFVTVPSPDWCTWPAVSSWPLFDGAWISATTAVEQFPAAFDACRAMGAKVISDPAEFRWPPVCAGGGMRRPCLREPLTAWRLGEWIDPGLPERGCGDVVLELLPRDECERRRDCRSVPFGDGRLWFSRSEVDLEVW